MGAPSGHAIGEMVLAHNANRTVPDLLANGAFVPRASIATLASAMDVGNPSNLERLRALYPDLGELRTAISAEVVSDEQIRDRIRSGFAQVRADLVPAYRHRRRGLRSAARGATPKRALDPGGHRASGQIP